MVETENDNKVALAALEQGATDAPLTTDGADDGELERELTQMEADADRLQKEGVISTDDANMKRAEVAKTRKLFRDLPAAERIAIIKRRREIGRQLLERQLSGAAVVTARVRLNHTRLRPLFEQWWPYINRMSINMQRFGRSTFGENDKEVVNSALEKLWQASRATSMSSSEWPKDFASRRKPSFVRTGNSCSNRRSPCRRWISKSRRTRASRCAC